MTPRNVLITGINRGLGLELARGYLEDGWRVHGTVRQTSEALTALDDEHAGLTVHTLALDDFEAIDRLAASLRGTTLDVLLMSAGTMGNVDFARHGLAEGGFGSSDFDDWNNVLTINLLAPMKLAEAFVDHVAAASDGKMIALTSMVASMALNTVGGLYAYRSSKAGLNAVMRSLAVDLRDRGITVAPIHPGWAKTDMGGPHGEVEVKDSADGIRKVIAALTPADSGRFLCYDGEELPW